MNQARMSFCCCPAALWCSWRRTGECVCCLRATERRQETTVRLRPLKRVPLAPWTQRPTPQSRQWKALAPAKAGRPKFLFDWSSVETTDYKQYAANLRAMGFAGELVRSMVIADIGAVFAPEEQKLPKAAGGPRWILDRAGRNLGDQRVGSDSENCVRWQMAKAIDDQRSAGCL